jgi:hypothetical protein
LRKVFEAEALGLDLSRNLYSKPVETNGSAASRHVKSSRIVSSGIMSPAACGALNPQFFYEMRRDLPVKLPSFQLRCKARRLPGFFVSIFILAD